MTRWRAILLLAAACLAGGCDEGASGPHSVGSAVDGIASDISARSGQLSAVTRAYRDIHGAWPATLADLEKVAAERKIAFDASIYERVTITPLPDGGARVDFATRLRTTANGSEGPGTGSLTLPGK